MGDTIIASSLLKVVEVWTPSADGTLVVDSAMYADVDAFGVATQSLRLASGTGLPGWVSEARVPVLFDDLSSADFVRSGAATESNLGAGFGLPVFDGDELTAVMIFLFDADELARGAFESWLPNTTRHELELGTGYYSDLDRFRRLSQYLRFPYGAGLPGEVWQTLTPQLIDRLGESSHFLRASGAVADGLDSGLAVPVVSGADHLNAVFVMLSSNASPIARALQIWVPSETEGVFELSEVVAPSLADLAGRSSQLRSVPGEGLIGRVLDTRKPAVVTDVESDDPVLGGALSTGVLSWGLAWPVIVHDRVTAICVVAD
ncbi:hypothetical protein GC176_18020 [bacterium]|nr:hypothetical protein [bacterium]